MAELTEGTYIILSVGSTKAIDVKGANDKSGTNVQQYTVNKSDAQIWSLAKPEDEYWQAMCSLTGKCLDVESSQMTSGTNVRQWDDNNTAAQRWNIVSDGSTATYSGTSYDTYVIKPSSNSGLALDVAGGSGSDGANIRIYTANSTNAQRWMFIPASCLKEAGTYEIVLAADTSMCVEIAESSTANSASIQVNSRNDANNQIFRADVDEETFLVRLFNVNSDKLIDVKNASTEAGAPLIQYVANNGANQNWLPVQVGTVKIDSVNVPTFELRAQVGTNLCMDCKGQGKTAKTIMQTWTRNNGLNQRFALVKTEIVGNDIEMPGALYPTKFSRTGHGDVSVTGLSFQSKGTKFQARYKIRTYGTNMSSYTDSEWMNLANNSTSRSGWGDAWTETFTATPVDGVVSLPFTKTIATSASSFATDIFIEVRQYVENYGSGNKAHGPICSTTIRVAEIPTVSVTSMGVALVDDTFAIVANMSDSLGVGCSWIRGRLVDSSGNVISGWVTNTVESLTFKADGTLRRLPTNNEVLTIQYSMLSANGISLVDTANYTFSYGSGSTLSPTVTYTTDGTLCADIESADDDVTLCFISITDDFENRLIAVKPRSKSNSKVIWRVTPPLNKHVDVTILCKGYNDSGWDRATVDCFVEAHEFIWNWEKVLSYDSCAAIFINSNTPPQQARTYTSDASFAKPANRRFPVAFSSRAVEVDLTIEGVIVDEGVQYVAAGPLPAYATLPDVKKLVALSGDGIHPTYRTPYGDLYQVVIEKVDVGKIELNLSKAVVTQRAVED